MPIHMKKLSNKWRTINLSQRGVSWLLTLALGIAAFLFWGVRYPFALTYQEQAQLFLFDCDYFVQRMADPGGLAIYVAEFLVQFDNLVMLGALLMAFLFMLVQRLTWHLMQQKAYYALSFVPVVMLWCAMGDENVMMTYAVAQVMTMGAILLLRRCQQLHKFVRYAIVIIAIPLLYWLIGPMVLLVAVCILPLSVVWALAVILLSAHYLPYSMLRVVLGVGYYRSPELMPYLLIAIPVVVAGLYWTYQLISNMKSTNVKEMLACVVVVGLAIVIIPLNYNAKTYEMMEYDYLVRVADWDGVIRKAEQKIPDTPTSVSVTNLALAMHNQLGDRIFDFYQRGSEGLLPDIDNNYPVLQLLGEIYFRLGLVNTAQRLAFEAMEAIPNYNKSPRVMKRLAETNMINGEYKVAEKYLKMLEKTIFYRLWAKRMMAMLGNEKAINEHPLYGTLRQYRLQEDFLFSDKELDKICGHLVMHNPDNQVAIQYLLMIPLLDRDEQRFMQYFQYVQKKVKYNPRSCQEAVALAYMQQYGKLPDGLVSPYVAQQLNEFGRIYSSAGKDAPELRAFKNTAWYYLLVGE